MRSSRENEKRRTSEEHLLGIRPGQYQLLRGGYGKENPWRKPREKGVLEAMEEVSFKEELLNSVKCSRDIQNDEYCKVSFGFTN